MTPLPSNIVTLESICHLLGWNKETAYRRANDNETPFPVFKLVDKRTAPFLCYVKDLEAYVNKQYSKAKKHYDSLH